jgi:hypothetical protein
MSASVGEHRCDCYQEGTHITKEGVGSRQGGRDDGMAIVLLVPMLTMMIMIVIAIVIIIWSCGVVAGNTFGSSREAVKTLDKGRVRWPCL